MNSLARKTIFIFSIFLSFFNEASGSGDSLQVSKFHHQLEFNASGGYIFQTSSFLKGNTLTDVRIKPIDNFYSLHLKYGFRFPENSYMGRNYPGAYQGIGVSYTDFHSPSEIGAPVSLYLYQGAPVCSLARALTLNYEWNFGASFLWKPYDAETNPSNIIIGSKINAYINLGLYLNWQLSDKLKFRLGAEATHYSNGNTEYPNGGINTTSMRTGVVYSFDSFSTPSRSSFPATPFRHNVSYDLLVYGACRFKGITEEHYLVPGHFGVAGFNFSPLYAFNRYLKAGISLDGKYDESSNLENHVADRVDNDKVLFSQRPVDECFSLGLSARVEFVMPIFSINFGMGKDMFYSGDNSHNFYQMLALKTSITRNLYLNIGYQLSEFHSPKNLMIGLGFRFHNKK